jgi:hypothetical protein
MLEAPPTRSQHPASSDTDEQLWRDLSDRLKTGLGPFGYQWLCGCAVYPRLRFALTLRLGTAIAQAVGRDTPDEDEAIALFRLSWFRHGQMPAPIRAILSADLLPQLRTIIQDEIARAVYSAGLAAARDADDPAPLLRPPEAWRKAFATSVADRTGDAIEIDRTFRDFVRRERSRFYPDGSAFLKRNWVALVLLLVSTAALFLI